MNWFGPSGYCGCCGDCDEAPSRAFCQYRSGTNGQTVTTRPTVAIHFELSGTQTPACGICDFDKDYTFTCGTNIGPTFYTCTFNADFFGFDQRRYDFSTSGTATGFVVQISELVLHRGIEAGRRVYQYYYDYDNFAYTDCDGNPQTDTNGAVSFSLASSSVDESYHTEMCWSVVDVLTVANN